jgi:hypothetical protein
MSEPKMTDPSRCAAIAIDMSALAVLLDLPPGMSVVAMSEPRYDFLERRLYLHVVSPHLEQVPEGARMPVISVRARETEIDGKVWRRFELEGRAG